MAHPNSGVCPLCRRPFRTGDSIRKLHMDPPPPEAPEVAQSDEQAFIQRILTLSWHSTETNNDPDTREELIVEIEGYLESKGQDEVRVFTLVRLRWRAKAHR